MGIWSCTIMGSDSAWDRYEYYLVICVSNYESQDDDGKYTIEEKRQMIEGSLEELVSIAKNNDDIRLSYQVLGYFLMKHGVKINEDLKETIRSHSDAESEANSWKEEDFPSRCEYLEEFRNAIKKHKSSITKISEETLMEAIDKHLKAGKKGLVNKEL